MRRFTAVVGGLAFGLLAACGGGGDSGGGGGAGGGGGGGSPVVYTGNTNGAVITATNAAVLIADVLGSGDESVSLAVAGNEEGFSHLSQGLGRSTRVVASRALSIRSGFRLAIPIDATEPCDSGFVRIVGTLTDSGTGSLSVSYSDCRTGNDTLSGAAMMQVDAFDLANGVLTDFTLIFTRLTVRGPGVSTDMSGSQRSQANVGAHTETFTANMVVVNNLTGRVKKAENLVFVDVYDNIFSPTSYVETITGRIYHHVHGFVDISTTVQLVFPTLAQDDPSSGQIVLTGAAGSKIRLTALSTTLITFALDLDGDDNFEFQATLNWSDLSGPAGANLADSDGDGMHDGWESTRGLDPSAPGDALADADGDGANNRSEYMAGSNPNSAASTPPATGVAITLTDAPDPVTVGANLTYFLTVSNSSPVPAANVVVTHTLPTGVSFVSASASQGSCSGTGPVTCNVATIAGFASVSISILASPSAEGVITSTATVATSSFDPVTTDNSAASTTTVGTPATGIQALIDAAASGDIVSVPPGIYYGGLDFKGKNIVLQSSSGAPSNTILHGNQSTVVRMGPGGTIRWLTITGGRAFFGAGIQVTGAGSLIFGNIFDGNVAEIGGTGAAVEGNNASPIIERNTFRNNSCDNQFTAGVLSFINASSPRIINNIFENNPCRGVNMTIPSGSTPEVINNTFVGNRTAIRVDRRVSQATQAYRNNLLVQNGVGLELEFGGDAENPVWQNNMLWANTVSYRGTASQTGSNGNIEAAPSFVDQAAGNYRLQAGSSAIDTGSATGAPATDFDGTARPQGAGIDIGAFERVP